MFVCNDSRANVNRTFIAEMTGSNCYQMRIEVDDERRDENSETLDEVADDVNEGRPDVDVLASLSLLGYGSGLTLEFVRVAVTVAVLTSGLVTVAVLTSGLVAVAVAPAASAVCVTVLVHAAAHSGIKFKVML